MPTIRAGAERRRGGGAGFAMLEALVAMLIFSIGALGVVSLQAQMTKAQTASKYRADAAYLAQHLIGAMWADRPNLANYSSASCATHAPCSEWLAKVAAQLPGGASSVDVDPASGNVTISIRWRVPGGGAHRYTTATAIRG